MGVLYDIYKELNMESAITPEEFEERMLTITETTRTRAERVYEMKKLVVELLIDLGYGDGAEIFADSAE